MVWSDVDRSDGCARGGLRKHFDIDAFLVDRYWKELRTVLLECQPRGAISNALDGDHIAWAQERAADEIQSHLASRRHDNVIRCGG
jgi:hypothetical protein